MAKKTQSTLRNIAQMKLYTQTVNKTNTISQDLETYTKEREILAAKYNGGSNEKKMWLL